MLSLSLCLLSCLSRLFLLSLSLSLFDSRPKHHTRPHHRQTRALVQTRPRQTRPEQADQSIRPDHTTSRPEHQGRPNPGRPDQTRAGKATQSEAKQSKENRSTAKQSKAKQIKSEASNVVQLTRLLGGKLPSTTMSDMLFGPEDPRLTAVRQEEWHKMADQPLYKKLGLSPSIVKVRVPGWWSFSLCFLISSG